MPIERYVVNLTTNTSGGATASTDLGITGPILSVQYVKTDFANGVDFTVTTANSGQTIWQQSDVNASTFKRPKVYNQDTAGGDITTSFDHIFAQGEKVTVVVAQGGSVTTGQVIICAMNNPIGGL